jgi:hypothetical protein
MRRTLTDEPELPDDPDERHCVNVLNGRARIRGALNSIIGGLTVWTLQELDQALRRLTGKRVRLETADDVLDERVRVYNACKAGLMAWADGKRAHTQLGGISESMLHVTVEHDVRALVAVLRSAETLEAARGGPLLALPGPGGSNPYANNGRQRRDGLRPRDSSGRFQ